MTPIELTSRQRDILRRVLDEYVTTGEPVGSKGLVERAALPVSASTVRAELAELEALGYLTHPHTSAGRVPTERGYRFYADSLLEEVEPRPSPLPLDLTALRAEIDEALEATAEMLARVTRLLALVSAPPLAATVVRHVEVLLLQPRVVMVVVITSTGGVSKRTFLFEDPVDPGLARWAHEYLNDRVAGLTLGTHVLRQRFDDPGLTAGERAFLAVLRPALTDLVDTRERRVFVGGAAALLDDARSEELAACRRVLQLLERRAEALALVDDALAPRRPFVRVGGELENPELRDVALVGMPYGVGTRALGAVGLVGPVRMDYGTAIRSVRAAAYELSRFVEDVYEEN